MTQDPNDFEKDLHNRIEEDEDNANWVHAEDDYNHATDGSTRKRLLGRTTTHECLAHDRSYLINSNDGGDR